MRFAFLAVLLALAPPSAGLDQASLPTRTDIPADFSTKLCPSEAAARQLLSEFHRPTDYNIIDIPHLFRGLRKTACVQRSGPVEIRQVLLRRDLDLIIPRERYIAYRGVTPAGKEVFGVVDESWLVRLPRTPLDAFKQSFTNGGWLKAGRTEWGVEYMVQFCSSVAAARAVVAALGSHRSSDTARQSAFDAAARRHRCTSTVKRFRPIAVYETDWIGCGEECATEWRALEALNERGRRVGLLFGYTEAH